MPPWKLTGLAPAAGTVGTSVNVTLRGDLELLHTEREGDESNAPVRKHFALNQLHPLYRLEGWRVVELLLLEREAHHAVHAWRLVTVQPGN